MDAKQQLAAMGWSADRIAAATVNGKPLAEASTSNTVTAVRCMRNGVLRIVVPGPAPGKPRQTRRDKWAKRPAVVRYREWCDLVRSIAGIVPAAEKVERIDITACFEPPKSWSKRKRCGFILEQHRSKPDCDNVTKAVLDCLWPDDDAGIAWTVTRKFWDWTPRLEIEIVLSRETAGKAGD